MTDPTPLERSTGALAPGDDATPTPPRCPAVLDLPGAGALPCLGPKGHPGMHYHEHPGIGPGKTLLYGPDAFGVGARIGAPMLPRALDVDDHAVDRLADALDLGRPDDDGPPLLEVVAEALAAAYADTTFATAGRLIDELENAGYRIRPIGGLAEWIPVTREALDTENRASAALAELYREVDR